MQHHTGLADDHIDNGPVVLMYLTAAASLHTHGHSCIYHQIPCAMAWCDDTVRCRAAQALTAVASPAPTKADMPCA